MYATYFGLAERPFSLAPDPRYFYLGDAHREALAHLLYGIGEGGSFVVLTGEVGTGKTTVCRALLEQLPVDVDVDRQLLQQRAADGGLPGAHLARQHDEAPTLADPVEQVGQ